MFTAAEADQILRAAYDRVPFRKDRYFGATFGTFLT